MSIFRARTQKGYDIKVLSELLKENIKTACFEIDKDSISLRMMDNPKTVLIDMVLDASNFTLYKYRYPDPKMYIGVTLIHLYKMLKSIKKKDIVELFITSDHPTDLGIKVFPEGNTQITTSYIKIQTIQNIDIDIPTGYNNYPVIVPCSDFQKMCKGLGHVSQTTHIFSKRFLIKFTTDAGGVMKRSTEFGEFDDDEDDDEDEIIYSEDFDTEQLIRISKLASFSTSMQIYTKKNLPMLLRTTISNMGKISIYVKSKDMQKNEQYSNNEEEEDE